MPPLTVLCYLEYLAVLDAHASEIIDLGRIGRYRGDLVEAHSSLYCSPRASCRVECSAEVKVWSCLLRLVRSGLANKASNFPKGKA